MVKAGLLASISPFVVDYVARQKLSGAHMKYFTFRQLPVLPPSAYEHDARWCRETDLNDLLTTRVLELSYTAYD
jgi:hypothetical protein